MTGAALDHEKLIRVLGMLGSRHDGEILSAARQAERLRREAGLTWAEIVIPTLPPSLRREREINNLHEAIEYALEFGRELTSWEINFLRTIKRQRTPISDKQTAIVEQIVAKIRRAEAAA